MSLNKLIESMINNQNSSVKFDLTKSFVSNANQNKNYNYDNSLPVDVATSTWQEIEHDGRRYLMKIYKFRNLNHIKYFINEHIEKSISMNYNPEVNIKGNQVKCFLYTEDLGDITEVDIEYSKYLDEIYEDIFFIKGQ